MKLKIRDFVVFPPPSETIEELKARVLSETDALALANLLDSLQLPYGRGEVRARDISSYSITYHTHTHNQSEKIKKVAPFQYNNKQNTHTQTNTRTLHQIDGGSETLDRRLDEAR